MCMIHWRYDSGERGNFAVYFRDKDHANIYLNGLTIDSTYSMYIFEIKEI